MSEHLLRLPKFAPVRLVKGSHIVVHKLFEHDRGYIFQNADRRIVFALPFERDFTLIGTTDLDFTGEPRRARRRRGDRLSLPRGECVFPDADRAKAGGVACSRVCARSTTTAPASRRTSRATIIWYSTRPIGKAPLLTVYGGKITTYRRLAEEALHRLGHYIPARRHGPRTRHCRAAILRTTESRRWFRACARPGRS